MYTQLLSLRIVVVILCICTNWRNVIPVWYVCCAWESRFIFIVHTILVYSTYFQYSIEMRCWWKLQGVLWCIPLVWSVKRNEWYFDFSSYIFSVVIQWSTANLKRAHSTTTIEKCETTFTDSFFFSFCMSVYVRFSN